MANLGATFDATQVEPNGDFSPIPAGEYRAMIVESEIKDAKSGGRYLKLTWKVDGGEFDGRLVWQNLNLWNDSTKAAEIAQRELSSICHAVGKMNVQDSEELHHLPCLIRVAMRTQEGYAPQNDVKGIKAADGSKPATGGFGGGQQSTPQQQAANSGGGSLPWKKSA